MKKVYKGLIAASLAVAILAGGIFGFNLMNVNSKNSFVLSVGAAEITKDNSISVENNGDFGWSYGDSDDGVSYSISLPFECRGDGIETLTYTLDRGVFSVTGRKDNFPVIDGETVQISEHVSAGNFIAYTDEDRAELDVIWDKENGDHMSDEDREKEQEILSRYKGNAYSSFTVSYNNQHPDGSAFGFCGTSDDLNEDDKAYLKKHHDDLFIIIDSDEQLSMKRAALEKLIGNTIHVTAKFENGSTKTQDIKVSTTIGWASEIFPEEYQNAQDDIKDMKDYKDVFITYSLA